MGDEYSSSGYGLDFSMLRSEPSRQPSPSHDHALLELQVSHDSDYNLGTQRRPNTNWGRCVRCIGRVTCIGGLLVVGTAVAALLQKIDVLPKVADSTTLMGWSVIGAGGIVCIVGGVLVLKKSLRRARQFEYSDTSL